MKDESDIVNVPSKVFYQGEFGESEKPIIMNFYIGTIELDQQDNGRILISEDSLERLIKSIRQGKKDADTMRKP